MTRPGTRLLALAVVALTMSIAAACGTSGRTLRDPEPGATAPPRKAPAAGTLQSSTTLASLFAITTDAWSPGLNMPPVYTCDGTDVSPPLVLSQIPAGTVELVVTVTDPDANDFVHWVLAGIGPTTTAIEEGTVPAGSVQAANSAGGVGWSGPCPPSGSTHTYEFTLYALTAPSGVTQGEDPTAAIAAVRAAPEAIPPAVMTATYKR